MARHGVLPILHLRGTAPENPLPSPRQLFRQRMQSAGPYTQHSRDLEQAAARLDKIMREDKQIETMSDSP
jgi:hypothetical protein